MKSIKNHVFILFQPLFQTFVWVSDSGFSATFSDLCLSFKFFLFTYGFIYRIHRISQLFQLPFQNHIFVFVVWRWRSWGSQVLVGRHDTWRDVWEQKCKSKWFYGAGNIVARRYHTMKQIWNCMGLGLLPKTDVYESCPSVNWRQRLLCRVGSPSLSVVCVCQRLS